MSDVNGKVVPLTSLEPNPFTPPVKSLPPNMMTILTTSPWATCGDQEILFKQALHDLSAKLTPFMVCNMLINLLEQLEHQKELDERADAQDEYLNVVVLAEYLIATLYSDSELRYNPFLMHWVKSVMRCQPALLDAGKAEQDPVKYPLWWVQAQKTRLTVIKCAFGSKNLVEIRDVSPKSLLTDVESASYEPIPIDDFKEMLESQGMHPTPTYSTVIASSTAQQTAASALSTVEPIDGPPTEHAPHETSASAVNATNLPGEGKGRVTGSPPLDNLSVDADSSHADAGVEANDAALPFHNVDEFEDALLQSGQDALVKLANAPPTLTNLELLTRVLQDQRIREILAPFGIRSVDVSREHFIHALRRLENATASSPHLGYSNVDVGREVQVLAVYLKHAISHGLLDYDMVRLDIEEFCVRYVWVSDVQDFRAWLHDALRMSQAGLMSEPQGLSPAAGLGG